LKRFQKATNRIRRIQDFSQTSVYSSDFQSLLREPLVVRELAQSVHQSLHKSIFCALRSTKVFMWSAHQKTLGTTGLQYTGNLLKLGIQRVKSFYEPLANTWLLSHFKLKTKTFKGFSTQNKSKICSHRTTVRKYPKLSLFFITNKTVCHE
jgi:hypothetical protein